MKHLGLSFLLGLVSATGFQPLGLWPLTILAFLGLLLLLEQAPHMRTALARGWWFGMGQFVLGLNWIATAFTYQAAMPAWLGWVAVVVLSFYLSVYPAMATGLAWRWGRPHNRPRRAMLVLILAAAWIVTEWLRGTMFTGFAWNPAGVVFIDSWAKWLARLVGTYGLSGLAILWAGLLWWALHHRSRALGMAVALLPLLLADLRLTGPAVELETPLVPLHIRVVQPNIRQEDRQDPAQDERNFYKLLRLSGRPDGMPRLIFWPEAAVPYELHRGDPPRLIAQAIGPDDLLLTGGIKVATPPPGVAAAEYNSLYLLGPGALIHGRYDKAHLVPYGEYLPMRPFLTALGLSRLVPGDGDILAGPGPRTLALPGRAARVGGQICYEIIFSGEVVDRANRPDFIFNPSNDAWFGAWGPPQHFAQARMRALEEGLPVIRSTPTGITGVINAQGQVVARLPRHEEGVIDTRLPPAAAATPFARLGNVLPFLFALLLVAGAIAVRRKTR